MTKKPAKGKPIDPKLFIYKSNSLGSAVICILSALAYKKKISDSYISVLRDQQSKLLACMFLIASADDETINYFFERKALSLSQLHSLKAKILMEGYHGNMDTLFASSFKAVSSKRMQLNILHVTEEIFKQSAPLQWLSDQQNPSIKNVPDGLWESIKNVPDELWEYDLNIEEQNVLTRMKKFWSIELKGPFRYQEGEHKEGLKVEDFVKTLEDVN